MEQKDYKMEIIDELLKQSNHVRELAKELKINHMMIARKIKELTKENVVDFNQEGKNKVFFLKKSEEARNHIFMTEYYKLNKLLKKHPRLRKIIKNIQKNDKVDLAIIFGSYAKGLTKKDSDIDVFIHSKDKNIKKELSSINSKLSIKLGTYDKKNLLIKEIEKNHVIIKGVELYYAKNKFFEEIV